MLSEMRSEYQRERVAHLRRIVERGDGSGRCASELKYDDDDEHDENENENENDENGSQGGGGGGNMGWADGDAVVERMAGFIPIRIFSISNTKHSSSWQERKTTTTCHASVLSLLQQQQLPLPPPLPPPPLPPFCSQFLVSAALVVFSFLLTIPLCRPPTAEASPQCLPRS